VIGRSPLVGAAAAALLLLAVGCSDDGTRSVEGPGDAAAPADEDWIARTDDDAVFTVDCDFSHRAPDDPIVHPGEPGASHSHEFFGSTATDASSTGPSLHGTPTTCEDPDDTAAYWVPTLTVRGVPVDPTFVRAYYRARPGVDVRHVSAPPTGLAVLSGDPDATDHGPGHDGGHDAEHDHSAEASGGGWGCGLRPRRLRAEPPLDCTGRSPLALQLRFPDCWDGENLDSADHRSHVARSVDGRCPATHPVLMTEVQLTVTWPVTGADAADVALASGDLAGAHGDFLNGWDEEALWRHVELCIRSKANCTVG
jgi:hypothetical protein